MKGKVVNLAGMSFPESINFFGNKGTAEVNTVDFKLPPTYTKEKSFSLYRVVKKFPLIRGYAVLIDLIMSIIKSIFKSPLAIFAFLAILAFMFLRPEEIVITHEVRPGVLSNIIPDNFWSQYFFDIALFGFLIIFVFLATKNHAAEHKAISAYETNQNLSLKNIKLQPKENCRCGTVLVVWFWILTLPLTFFLHTIGTSSLITALLQITGFSFAYEIFNLARRKDKIGKIIYFPGWLGQKLTTREPNNKLLLRSRQGLMRLLDEENYRYQK